MAHSPDGKRASPRVAAAVLEGPLLLRMSMSAWTCLTWSGLLILSSASRPAIPLALVASGASWMALNCSNCAQVGQAVVKAQGAALAALIFFAASISSGQVWRRLGRIEARLLEGVLVVEHDGRRAVERHGHHAAVGQAVVPLHRRDIGAGVERSRRRLSHPARTPADRPARRHHGGGAHLEHLAMCGALPAPEGGDGAHHGLRVGALTAGVDQVLGLARR